jgi:hypothetical protein
LTGEPRAAGCPAVGRFAQSPREFEVEFRACGFLIFVSLFHCLQRFGHFPGWLGHFPGEPDIFRVLSTFGQLTNNVRINHTRTLLFESPNSPDYVRKREQGEDTARS